MDGLDFSISTEGLIEKGEKIATESNNIKQALNDINEARTSLESWVSTNKDKFDGRIAAVLPKMQDMTEAIDSYSKVAIQTSEKATSVENSIANSIERNFYA